MEPWWISQPPRSRHCKLMLFHNHPTRNERFFPIDKLSTVQTGWEGTIIWLSEPEPVLLVYVYCYQQTHHVSKYECHYCEVWVSSLLLTLVLLIIKANVLVSCHLVVEPGAMEHHNETVLIILCTCFNTVHLFTVVSFLQFFYSLLFQYALLICQVLKMTMVQLMIITTGQ